MVSLNVRLCAITKHVFEVAVFTLKWFAGYTGSNVLCNKILCGLCIFNICLSCNNACALAAAVVKGISFFKKVQEDDKSKGYQDAPAYHSAVC